MTARMADIANGRSYGRVAIQRKLDWASPAKEWHLKERHVPGILVRLKRLIRLPNTDAHGGGLLGDDQH